MKRFARTALVVAALAAGLANSGCSYNTFVTQEEAIRTQWAQVENQLQRRNDLIPNLVATAEGFAAQERDVFGATVALYVLEEIEGVSARILAQQISAAAPPPAAPPPGLDETQLRVWELLGQGPRHLDEMVQQLGLGVAVLAGLLLTLEMKKAVRRLPGNRYERSR